MKQFACPACGSTGTQVFHEQRKVPVNSCLLVDDYRTAIEFPRGDIALSFCRRCAFVANVAFDPERSRYTEHYEETQGFSPTFRRFAADLARRWVDRYEIRDRDVLEIGCGKGEFLELMVEAGDNRGLGVDPSYVPGRVDEEPGRLAFIRDFWSAAYAALPADVVVCRHTLEHIQPVGQFVADLRAVVGDRPDRIVLFEVPDTLRVLEQAAFWDIYYEHCSYFSPGSLARLFRRCGFAPIGLDLAYDDQYVLLDAVPTCGATDDAPEPELELEDDLERSGRAVESFAERFEARCARLRQALDDAAKQDGPAVLWGAGSKAVSFVTTLGVGDEVKAAVDINPFKHGRYLAGSGHRVIAPEELRDDPPGTVFVMNDIYLDEVAADLRGMGMEPELVAL